jgi:hypothetical protein
MDKHVTPNVKYGKLAALGILAALLLAAFFGAMQAWAGGSKVKSAPASPRTCNALDVAMLQGFYPNTSLSSKIAARPGVATVDAFDTYSTTPSLTQLQPYDLVVIAGSGNYADRVQMGNVLADYVDGGGVVVHTAFENVTFSYLQGRWLSGNYSPLVENVQGFTQPDYLGVYSTTHPLMQGVGELLAENKVQAVLTSGSVEVARYHTNSALTMIAYKGRVVALNAFLSRNEAMAGWSGDWGTVAVNAANWIYNCPPPPTPGTPIPTSTPIPTVTGTPPTATVTPVPTCGITYSDVPQGSTFYVYITCLACDGVIGGYSDGTFRPGNNVTRGQLSKIVANAAGFTEPPVGQTYTDVEVGSTFYAYVQRLSARGIISGYECGTAGEPCDAQNRPYFRTNANATRGQISKIISNAAGYSQDPGGQIFTDVDVNSTFYAYVQRLSMRGIISGYDCGTVGEPCDTENRPYFRPSNNATRGQTSKLVGNAFYSECTSGGVAPQR